LDRNAVFAKLFCCAPTEGQRQLLKVKALCQTELEFGRISSTKNWYWNIILVGSVKLYWLMKTLAVNLSAIKTKENHVQEILLSRLIGRRSFD
jgi:hypothetical protein